MKEYKVGEEFYVGRIKLRVKESGTSSCVGCIFQKMPYDTCTIFHVFIGTCDCNTREDKKQIIFVKIEEDEN